jgi:hypothetical protein
VSVYDSLKRPGWLTFTAVLLFAFGAVRVISGISYLADSNKVANLTQGLFGGSVFWWGIWDLVIAALALTGGYSLLSNHEYGRVIGYLFGIFVVVEGFMLLFYAPWYGAFAILIGILVMYALAVASEWVDTTG